MSVAFVALIGALSGTAIALPGKNTVDSGDIKNGAVKSADIKNNGVRGKDIRSNTVRGSDIAESSLGTVPSASVAGKANTANSATNATHATNATNAGNASTVNRNTIVKVNYRANTGAVNTAIFNGGGLQISAACIGGIPDVTATTTKANSSIYTSLNDVEDPANPLGADLESGGFDTGDTFDLLAGAASFQKDPAIIQFEFDALDGTVATGTLATDESGEVNDCLVTGHVTIG